jgi:hypothetical protein
MHRGKTSDVNGTATRGKTAITVVGLLLSVFLFLADKPHSYNTTTMIAMLPIYRLQFIL